VAPPTASTAVAAVAATSKYSQVRCSTRELQACVSVLGRFTLATIASHPCLPEKNMEHLDSPIVPF